MGLRMSNPFKSKEFKSLQREWYKKLKDDNFKDIEDQEVDRLKVWHSYDFTRKNKQEFEAREEYFSLCLEFSREYKFESESDRKVWEYHSEGYSIREISTLMRSDKKKRGFRKSHICNIVRRLITIMEEGFEWKKTSLKKIS